MTRLGWNEQRSRDPDRHGNDGYDSCLILLSRPAAPPVEPRHCYVPRPRRRDAALESGSPDLPSPVQGGAQLHDCGGEKAPMRGERRDADTHLGTNCVGTRQTGIPGRARNMHRMPSRNRVAAGREQVQAAIRALHPRMLEIRRDARAPIQGAAGDLRGIFSIRRVPDHDRRWSGRTGGSQRAPDRNRNQEVLTRREGVPAGRACRTAVRRQSVGGCNGSAVPQCSAPPTCMILSASGARKSIPSLVRRPGGDRS